MADAEGTQSVMQGQANLTAAREARKRARSPDVLLIYMAHNIDITYNMYTIEDIM